MFTAGFSYQCGPHQGQSLHATDQYFGAVFEAGQRPIVVSEGEQKAETFFWILLKLLFYVKHSIAWRMFLCEHFFLSKAL